MLKVIFFLCCIFIFDYCFSQEKQADSLLALLKDTESDTAQVNILNELAVSYFNSSPENAIKYATQAKQLAEKSDYKLNWQDTFPHMPRLH